MGDGLRVWASGPFSPVVICDDARTPDPSRQGYPGGTAQGQFGWDVGLAFSNTGELGDKLAQVVRSKGKKIDRLAIVVHGTPRHVDVDGKIGTGSLSASIPGGMTGQQADDQQNSKTFCMQTFDSYAPAWRRVAGNMNAGGIVLFMSCNFGQMQIGGDILKKMSKELFPGVSVVGFINVGIAPGRITVNKCMLPGMKITDATVPSGSEEEEAQRQLLVRAEPWASETSQQAKVALNGALVKNPEGMTVQKGLAGDWSGDTGGPTPFLAHFDVAGRDVRNNYPTTGNVYWALRKGEKRHYGEWKLESNRLTFEFWDDPPGWKRKWTAMLNLTDGEFRSYMLKGDVTINGQPHGWFTFSKTSD